MMRVGPATHRVIKAHDSDDEEEDFGGLLCHGEVSHAPPPALYGGNGGPGGSAHPRVTAYADAGHFKVGEAVGRCAVHKQGCCGACADLCCSLTVYCAPRKCQECSPWGWGAANGTALQLPLLVFCLRLLRCLSVCAHR